MYPTGNTPPSPKTALKSIPPAKRSLLESKESAAIKTLDKKITFINQKFNSYSVQNKNTYFKNLVADAVNSTFNGITVTPKLASSALAVMLKQNPKKAPEGLITSTVTNLENQENHWSVLTVVEKEAVAQIASRGLITIHPNLDLPLRTDIDSGNGNQASMHPPVGFPPAYNTNTNHFQAPPSAPPHNLPIPANNSPARARLDELIKTKYAVLNLGSEETQNLLNQLSEIRNENDITSQLDSMIATHNQLDTYQLDAMQRAVKASELGKDVASRQARESRDGKTRVISSLNTQPPQ